MTRTLALLLTVLTGFTGLVYEVTWQKYLATLLGSHAEATVAVLAIFLGGLSAGYALFGKLSSRLGGGPGLPVDAGRIVKTYGVLEAGIGLWAFAFPWLFDVVQAASYGLPLPDGPVAFGADVLLSSLLIGPPAVLMGGTIPMLTQALSRDLSEATRFHALVYGLNTVGAFAGALAAAFWLIPALGLDGCLALMGAINVVAGLLFLLLARAVDPAASGQPDAGAPTVSIGRFPVYVGIVLLNGFAMLTLQVVFMRVGAFSLGSSHFTFAMVVAVFVLCIALGSLAVSPLRQVKPAVLVITQWGLVLCLMVLYGFLENAPYYAHLVRVEFGTRGAEFSSYYLRVFFWMLAVLGPPVLLSGAVLPLVFGHLRQQVGDLGAVAGRLYSWNTVGSLLGALVGGYLLLFWMDLDAVYRLATGALLLAAVLLSLEVFGGAVRVGAVALSLAGIAALFWFSSWDPLRLSSGLFRYRETLTGTAAGPDAFFAGPAIEGREILFYTDDPVMSVAVVEQSLNAADESSPWSLSIFSNGKSDSSVVGDAVTLSLLALLPAVNSEAMERVFVIGLGTGVTAAEFAALDSVDEVVVAEISPGVVEAAPHFAESTNDLLDNPKVRIVEEDAYRALKRSSGFFDVISAEPSNPWVTGVEMLYSEEFLRVLKSRLAPGGVSVQWMHLYEMDDETVELVLRTYMAVFDRVSIWAGRGSDLLILGHNGEAGPEDIERVRSRAQRPDIQAGLARIGIHSVEALAAYEVVPDGGLRYDDLPEGRLHTLKHPILSDLAARAFFRAGAGSVPYVGALSAERARQYPALIRKLVASESVARSDAYGRYAEKLCARVGTANRQCAVFLASWLAEEPESEGAKKAVAQNREAIHAEASLNLPDLRLLFGAGGEEEISLGRAERLLRMFEDHYQYTTPFDPDQLRRLLGRCREPANRPGGCEALRVEFEERVSG